MKSKVLVAGIFLIAVGQIGFAQRRLPEGTRVERDIAYVVDGSERQKLDLYIPAGDQTERPIVVWIHGGGWARGSKDNIGACSWVLAHGYAVASVGYRLTDEAVFPNQMMDCKRAITWLRENGWKYGLSKSKIVVWGSSAGGHLASMVGLTSDPNTKRDDVCGVIDWYGPAELLTMQLQRKFPTRLDADAPDSFESKLIGGALQENRWRASQASPVSHVTADDPPFLIMHGDMDALVSIEQSRTLAGKLKIAGVDVQLVELPGAGHGGGAFQSDENRQTILRFLKESFNRVARQD